jgi:hypothetical protein
MKQSALPKMLALAIALLGVSVVVLDPICRVAAWLALRDFSLAGSGWDSGMGNVIHARDRASAIEAFHRAFPGRRIIEQHNVAVLSILRPQWCIGLVVQNSDRRDVVLIVRRRDQDWWIKWFPE